MWLPMCHNLLWLCLGTGTSAHVLESQIPLFHHQVVPFHRFHHPLAYVTVLHYPFDPRISSIAGVSLSSSRTMLSVELVQGHSAAQ